MLVKFEVISDAYMALSNTGNIDIILQLTAPISNSLVRHSVY